MEHKRSREEEESCNSSSSPEAKRFHADILLGMFDDRDEEDDVGVREAPFDVPEELATLMRSLEQEIALAASSSSSSPSPPPELGYLLEASDDELGIPPAAEDERGGGVEAERAAAMWFRDDDGMSGFGYDGLGFGFVRFEEEDDELDDGAPFDYARDYIWIV
ncbi:hypothetical protein BHE74_00007907 [Ensete ventricosum]|nr:hypothetical protein BHE74_00007907 [Ensete ventricosum]